jgi:hypothetical protein
MMVLGSWDAIVPSYGDLPIYIPPLKAFLSFGSFVLFNHSMPRKPVLVD